MFPRAGAAATAPARSAPHFRHARPSPPVSPCSLWGVCSAAPRHRGARAVSAPSVDGGDSKGRGESAGRNLSAARGAAPPATSGTEALPRGSAPGVPKRPRPAVPSSALVPFPRTGHPGAPSGGCRWRICGTERARRESLRTPRACYILAPSAPHGRPAAPEAVCLLFPLTSSGRSLREFSPFFPSRAAAGP